MLSILIDWLNKRAEETRARRVALDMVQLRAKYPKRKLRMKYQQALKEEIKQRLSADAAESSDPYIVMRDAQVGRYDGWSNYIAKEKEIPESKAMPRGLSRLAGRKARPGVKFTY